MYVKAKGAARGALFEVVPIHRGASEGPAQLPKALVKGGGEGNAEVTRSLFEVWREIKIRGFIPILVSHYSVQKHFRSKRNSFW